MNKEQQEFEITYLKCSVAEASYILYNEILQQIFLKYRIFKLVEDVSLTDERNEGIS